MNFSEFKKSHFVTLSRNIVLRKRRRWRRLALELACPLLFAALIAIAANFMNSYDIDKPNVYVHERTLEVVPPICWRQEEGERRATPCRIFLAPNSSELVQEIGIILEPLGDQLIRLEIFATEAEAEAARRGDLATTFAAVYFEEEAPPPSNATTATTTPPLLNHSSSLYSYLYELDPLIISYRIRTNATNYPQRFVQRGVEVLPASALRFAANGILWLKQSIDRAICIALEAEYLIEQQLEEEEEAVEGGGGGAFARRQKRQEAPDFSNLPFKLTPEQISMIQEMLQNRSVDSFPGLSDACPKPPPLRSLATRATPSPVFILLGGPLANFWLLSFIPLSVVVVAALIDEKEKGIREGLKMMGVSSRVYVLAWLFVFSTESFIIVTTMAVVGYYTHVFVHASVSLVIFILFAFTCSVVGFAFLAAALAHRQIVGGVVAFAFLVLTANLFAWATSPLATHLLLPIAPVAFTLCFSILFRYEALGIGLSWSHLNQYDYASGTTLARCIVALYVDACVYLLLAVYFGYIRPGPFGTRHAWHLNVHRFMYNWLLRLFVRKRGSGFMVMDEKQHELSESAAAAAPSDLAPIEQGRHDLCTFAIEVRVPNANDECRVDLRRLHKRYSPQGPPALVSLSMRIYSGEIVALLGENGAGKSTTINCLTGFKQATSGDVYIDGNSILRSTEAARQRMGVCPQHDVLFDELTAIEHLRFFARLRASSTSIDAMKELIASVGLSWEAAQKRTRHLSGGGRRKLSLAIALVGSPSFLVLDEPTSGLDARSCRLVWSLLKRLRANGVAVLISTHRMSEAEALGDRICILTHGHLAALGTPLFLKRSLASGYFLHLSMDKDADHDEAVTFVRERVSEATVYEASHDSKLLIIQLPFSSLDRFPRLFHALDEQKSSIGVLKYGISSATLEEVFLSVNRRANDVITATRELHSIMSTKTHLVIDDNDNNNNNNINDDDDDDDEVILIEDEGGGGDDGVTTARGARKVTRRLASLARRARMQLVATANGIIKRNYNDHDDDSNVFFIDEQGGGGGVVLRERVVGGGGDDGGGDAATASVDIVGIGKNPESPLLAADHGQSNAFSASFKQQALTVFRFRLLSRSRAQWLFLLFFPFFFLLISFAPRAKMGMKTVTGTIDGAPLVLSLQALAKSHNEDRLPSSSPVLLPYVDSYASTLASTALNLSEEELIDERLSFHFIQSSTTWSDELRASEFENLSALGGAVIDDATRAYYFAFNREADGNVTLYANLSSPFSALVAYNLYASAASYSTVRYNASLHAWDVVDASPQSYLAIFAYIPIFGIISLLSALISYHIAFEKAQKIRLQLSLIGLNPLAYWCGGLCADILSLWTALPGIFLAIFFMNLRRFLGVRSFAFVLLNLNYCVALVVGTYAMSIFFSSPHGAWVQTLFLHIFLAVAGYYIPKWLVPEVVEWVSGHDIATWQLLDYLVSLWPASAFVSALSAFDEQSMPTFLQSMSWSATLRINFLLILWSVGVFALLVFVLDEDRRRVAPLKRYHQWHQQWWWVKVLLDFVNCRFGSRLRRRRRRLQQTAAALAAADADADAVAPPASDLIGAKLPAYDDLYIEMPSISMDTNTNTTKTSIEYRHRVTGERFTQRPTDDELVAAERRRANRGNNNDDYDDDDGDDDDAAAAIVDDDNQRNRDDVVGVGDCVRLQRLYKSYEPPSFALRDLSLAVRRGEVVGLLGANGAGKSTTISIACRQEEVTAGDLRLGAASAAADDALDYWAAAAAGACTQDDTLYPNLTVIEHLELYALIRGRIPMHNRRLLAATVAFYVDACALREHAHKRAKALSGGTRRKLCLALALIGGGRRVIFVDEGSTGVDPTSKRRLWSVLRHCAVVDRRALIYTSHDIFEADSVCDRIAIVVNGRLRAIGNSQVLKETYGGGYRATLRFASPAHLDSFVASFSFEDDVECQEIEEQYGTLLQMRLGEVKTVGRVFQRLIDAKRRRQLVDFGLSQSTLESVFLAFAKEQE